jgi:hypothetical protein
MTRRNSITRETGVLEVENYHDSLKKNLMSTLEDQFRVIEKVRAIIKSANLDPSFNNKFMPANKEEFLMIPEDLYKFVVISMHHYETVEEGFEKWKKEYTNNIGEIYYPEIIITPPKDDVVNYAETW